MIKINGVFGVFENILIGLDSVRHVGIDKDVLIKINVREVNFKTLLEEDSCFVIPQMLDMDPNITR